MNNRPITEDDLQAFVDGQLPAERHLDVVCYLEKHPREYERIMNYKQERAFLHHAYAMIVEEPIPPELNIRRMVSKPKPMINLPKWGIALAACIMIAIGGAGGWMLRGMETTPMTGLMALSKDAAAGYEVYALDTMRPVEIIAQDGELLQAWSRQRMGKSFHIPQMTDVGYRFMGGRVLSTTHGASVMLMYDNDKGSRLVVLARPMKDQPATKMQSVDYNGVNGYVWSDNGLGYSLVGTIAAEQLHPLANEFRRLVTKSV